MSCLHKSRLLGLLLVLVLLLQSAAFAVETFPYTAYATDAVRLRARPSSSASILDVIKKGDTVQVTGGQGNYLIVNYQGKHGYVVSAFLSKSAQNATPPTGDPALLAKFPQLASGSKGAAVKALQEALEELGFYRSSLDGDFGRGTEQAVRAFQAANGLIENGYADSAMQQLLFEGRPLNSRRSKTKVSTLPAIDGITIRPGNRGDLVRSVQERLKELSYYHGKIDGIYGRESQDAVRAFQRANRITADGLAGRQTQDLLFRTASSTQGIDTSPAQPEQYPVATPAPLGEAVYPYMTTTSTNVNMRKRASTSAMRMMTVPTGATIQVLEDKGAFLRITYKDKTGYVAREFVNIPEQYLDGKPLPSDDQARILYRTLVQGDSGKLVRALQQALSELGFYSGSIDGIFGASTTSALKNFQKRNGLRETGIALPELQQLLYEKRVRNSKNQLVLTKTLPPVEGITMKVGDYGDAVYELHQMLVLAKHYDSTVGYEYTQATARAVTAFQKAHSIKQTGRADSFTVLALRTFVNKPQATEPIQTSPEPSDYNEPVTADNYVLIQSGTRGLAVLRLQGRLVDLGYYKITPDGLYNSDDIAAIRLFQQINGLNITGLGDLATQQTLYADYALRADAGQGVNPAMPDAPLKVGATGEAVRAMQSRLLVLKYLTGKADGIFGTQTARAVTNFQDKNKLKKDGIAGSQTLNALYSASAIPNEQTITTTPQPSPSPQTPTVLKIGDRGQEVLSMQSRLIALGYLKGGADGIFGPATFLSLKAFQERNRLDADGIAGRLTLAKLQSTSAVPADLSGPTPPSPTPDPVTPSFRAPKASEVRFANWYTEIRPIAQRLRDVVIYDFISGRHYNFRLFSLGKHADGTTLTKADTATMNEVLGVNNWTPRPVWVIFSDGRVYMASTHSHGHESDYIKDNGLTGHLCIHFPREMSEAAQTGPYAVSHQNTILAGWDLTRNMAR